MPGILMWRAGGKDTRSVDDFYMELFLYILLEILRIVVKRFVIICLENKLLRLIHISNYAKGTFSTLLKDDLSDDVFMNERLLMYLQRKI